MIAIAVVDGAITLLGVLVVIAVLLYATEARRP